MKEELTPNVRSGLILDVNDSRVATVMEGNGPDHTRRPERRVTLVDVARDAGVSRATASLVLRQSPSVADATRARVVQSMKTLGYVYHRGAASLRASRTQVLGLIGVESSNPFFTELSDGVEAELDGDGYVLLAGHNRDSLDHQARLLRSMLEHGVDGFILCPARGTTAETLEMRIGMPCVLVARRVQGAEAGYVGADNTLGAELATRHLLQHGARRIAFVGGAEDSSTRAERSRGVEAALGDSRRVPRPALSVPGPCTWEASHAVVRLILAGPSRPDAIVCYNDVVAFGALMAAWDMGLEPGSDLLVTGFDGIAAAAHQKPSLATVSTQPR